MKLSRRGFFKLAGASAAVAIAAPVVNQLGQAAAFIRPENLEMGVPHAFQPASVGTIYFPNDRLLFRSLILQEVGDPRFLSEMWDERGQHFTVSERSGHTLAEYRRSLADLIDRSYEEEIRRAGEMIQLTDGWAGYSRATHDVLTAILAERQRYLDEKLTVPARYRQLARTLPTRPT